MDNSTAKVSRKWTASDESAVALGFTPISNQLIMAKGSGEVEVLNFANENAKIVQTLKTNFKDTIKWILTTNCGRYLIMSDSRNVIIWSLINDVWKSYTKLPKYSGCYITSINVQSKALNLLVAYNDHRIIEYDLNEKCLTNFSKSISDQIIKFDDNDVIKSILFDANESNKIILHVGTKILILNKDKVGIFSQLRTFP